jgi:uncharacterized protein (TIGR02596 family)
MMALRIFTKIDFMITPKLNLIQKRNSSLGVRSGFTLIELLAVLAIIATISAVIGPAALGVITSTRLAQAGDDILARISQAQQIAMSESRPVEVRFYRMRDAASAGQNPPQYRGLMIVKYFQAGEADPTNPGNVLSSPLGLAEFGGIYRLPNSVVMSESNQLSTFMRLPENAGAGGGGSGSAELRVRRGNQFERLSLADAVAYCSFLCLPEATDLNAAQSWFVSLVSTGDEQRSPNELKNFYTIQIEPVTGRLMSYRP